MATGIFKNTKVSGASAEGQVHCTLYRVVSTQLFIRFTLQTHTTLKICM